MSEAVAKKKNTAYYINSIISLIIIFGFGQLPAVAPLTPLGMNLIGIFLGLLYAWVFVDIVWPSLVGLLALMLIGGMKPVPLLNASFGDQMVVMMFFIFVERALFCKMADNVWINISLFYEVGINSMHICVCLGKSELFLFFLCDSFRRTVGERSYRLS